MHGGQEVELPQERGSLRLQRHVFRLQLQTFGVTRQLSSLARLPGRPGRLHLFLGRPHVHCLRIHAHVPGIEGVHAVIHANPRDGHDGPVAAKLGRRGRLVMALGRRRLGHRPGGGRHGLHGLCRRGGHEGPRLVRRGLGGGGVAGRHRLGAGHRRGGLVWCGLLPRRGEPVRRGSGSARRGRRRRPVPGRRGLHHDVSSRVLREVGGRGQIAAIRTLEHADAVVVVLIRQVGDVILTGDGALALVLRLRGGLGEGLLRDCRRLRGPLRGRVVNGAAAHGGLRHGLLRGRVNAPAVVGLRDLRGLGSDERLRLNCVVHKGLANGVVPDGGGVRPRGALRLLAHLLAFLPEVVGHDHEGGLWLLPEDVLQHLLH
mmetsp:Transcript_11221/g.30618  ORF Transcript_11221/g.30618 Transcript_11221/m.30618 type:complete len:373 (-) Transcript_11221:531-1649(-)